MHKMQLLPHLHLQQSIMLAHEHHTIRRSLVANQLRITTVAATTLLKSLTPLLYPTNATAKHFVYDAIAHRAVTLCPTKDTLAKMLSNPPQHLLEVIRRNANHLGKNRQAPSKS